MFAALTLEHDPLKLEDLPAAFVSWVQDAGGFAAAALVIFVIYCLARHQKLMGWTNSGLYRAAFLIALVGAAVSYALLGVLEVPQVLRMLTSSPSPPPTSFWVIARWVALTAGGAFSLLGAMIPFLDGLTRMRARRIWALARLSFKEAIRRRVLWAVSALLLVFLFAGWFIDT